jgi:hypothetical protein
MAARGAGWLCASDDGRAVRSLNSPRVVGCYKYSVNAAGSGCVGAGSTYVDPGLVSVRCLGRHASAYWRSLGDSNPCFRRERATS